MIISAPAHPYRQFNSKLNSLYFWLYYYYSLELCKQELQNFFFSTKEIRWCMNSSTKWLAPITFFYNLLISIHTSLAGAQPIDSYLPVSESVGLLCLSDCCLLQNTNCRFECHAQTRWVSSLWLHNIFWKFKIFIITMAPVLVEKKMNTKNYR